MFDLNHQDKYHKQCGSIQNGQCEKSYEIKGGGQEMAVMVQVDDKI